MSTTPQWTVGQQVVVKAKHGARSTYPGTVVKVARKFLTVKAAVPGYGEMQEYAIEDGGLRNSTGHGYGPALTVTTAEIEAANRKRVELMAAIKKHGFDASYAGHRVSQIPLAVLATIVDAMEHPTPDMSLTGWPRVTRCPMCRGDAHMLHASVDSASYECRGIPTMPNNAYGEDRCGLNFRISKGQ